MFCLLLQQCLAYDTWLWTGSYQANISLSNGMITQESAEIKLQHELFQAQKYNNTKGLGMEALFKGSVYIPYRNITMYGNCTENYETCFFYVINAEITLSSMLRRMYKCLNGSTLADHNWLHMCLQAGYTKVHPAIYVNSIGFTIDRDDNIPSSSPFILPQRAFGKFRRGLNDTFCFSMERFNRELYVAEGKIFGLGVAISVIFVYLSWKSLADNFNTEAQLSHLCPHSFSWHISWEFSFGMFILSLANYDSHLIGFYTFLFALILVVYFTTQVPFIISLWRSRIHAEDYPDLESMRFAFVDRFAEMIVMMLLVGQASVLVFEYPYICITIMYGWFIPQIVHTARSPFKKRNDAIFVTTIAISRLSIVYYFTLYPYNISESHSVGVSVYATVYVAIQVIIVLLQNKFGGSFFLPASWRPVAFDYTALVPEPGTECPVCLCEIEEGDEAMVTPCHHAFHKQCLMRWLLERHCCPMCRHSLPRLEGEEDL